MDTHYWRHLFCVFFFGGGEDGYCPPSQSFQAKVEIKWTNYCNFIFYFFNMVKNDFLKKYIYLQNQFLKLYRIMQYRILHLLVSHLIILLKVINH